MTERNSSNSESHAAIIENRFENEHSLQDKLNVLLVRGKELESRTYASIEDAAEKGAEFVRINTQELSEFPELRTTLLIARGNGVLVANTLPPEATKTKVTYSINEEEPFRGLDPFETREFVLDSLASIPSQQEDGTYQVNAFIIGNETQTAKTWNSSINTGVSFLSATARTSLMVSCNSDDSEIDVLRLSQDIERQQAMIDLAKQAKRKDFVHDIAIINEELALEAEHKFTDLERVATLQSLGRKGLQYAKMNEHKADLLYNAIATTLVRGRMINVEGEVYFVNSDNVVEEVSTQLVSAKLLDVVPSVPTLDESRGPTLALATSDQTKIAYAPLAGIKKFQF